MSISVVGLGRLGLPLAAVLASAGLTVVGADVKPEVLESVRQRKPLFYEPGLRELLCSVSDRIVLVDDAGVAAFVTDVSVVLVPTPSQNDGSFSLKYVLEACRSIGEAIVAMETYHLVVISSTVMPGSCDGAIRQILEKESGKRAGVDFGLCYQPEFVRLGSVIDDMRHPDFLLIGESDQKAGSALDQLWRTVLPGPPSGLRCQVRHTSLLNAEITKLAFNAYMVTKIALANELAELCEMYSGADVDVVTETIELDGRIGKSFRGGTPAGGSCFPRDCRALLAAALNTDLPVVSGADFSNESQGYRLCVLVWKHLKKPAAHECVGVLGLAFKMGTKVTEEAFGLGLLERFGCGQKVVAYDPLVTVGDSVVSAQACADQADVLVVALPYGEFADVVFHEGQVVIDCWRILDKAVVEAAGAKYVGIGLGE